MAIATLIVVSGSSVDENGNGSSSDPPAAVSETTTTTSGGGGSGKKHYVVQPGDTLSSISLETGVSVEQLQALNPDVDPQALASGERLKLR